jgi:hypothetical protein
MENKKWISLLLILLVFGNTAQSEVEQIVLTWNAFICQDMCIPLIERNFEAIREVRNLQINAPSGVAVMGWDPNYPFSYEPFRYASAAVGIHIDTMRIRVRGTISHDIDNVYLVSNGDDARFLLIGPLHPEPGRYVPNYSLDTHPLPPDIKDRLLEAERKGFTVVISGPLFMPSHYPRTLITEQVRVNARESQMDLRYQR